MAIVFHSPMGWKPDVLLPTMLTGQCFCSMHCCDTHTWWNSQLCAVLVRKWQNLSLAIGIFGAHHIHHLSLLVMNQLNHLSQFILCFFQLLQCHFSGSLEHHLGRILNGFLIFFLDAWYLSNIILALTWDILDNFMQMSKVGKSTSYWLVGRHGATVAVAITITHNNTLFYGTFAMQYNGVLSGLVLLLVPCKALMMHIP